MRKRDERRYNEKALEQFVKLGQLVPADAPQDPDETVLEAVFVKYRKLFSKMSWKKFCDSYPQGVDESGYPVSFDGSGVQGGKLVGRVFAGPLSWRFPGALWRASWEEQKHSVYRLCRLVSETLAMIVDTESGSITTPLTFGKIYVTRTRSIELDPDAFHDGFLPALRQCGASRIRRCEICRMIFWAKPANKVVCSGKCRTAKSRKLNRDDNTTRRKLKLRRLSRAESKQTRALSKSI